MGAAIADWPSAGRFRVALAEFFCEPQDVDGRSTSAIDDLRDYGYLSRSELQVIARSPELERAWAARLAGDSRTAQAEFEAASGSSREAVAAHAQAMLLMYSTACPGELIASCSQLAEHLCASPDAAVRTAGIRALIGAAEERGAGIEALCEAARRADDDPELGVTAAEAHLVIARWWCRRREKEQHKLPEAEAFAGKAIDEYSIVISRAVDTSEPALQIIVQLALNEKTKLLMEQHNWSHAMTSSEQAVATPVPPDAPALLRATIAEAWVRRGVLLYDRNDTTEGAVEVLAELRRMFGNDPSPLVQGIVRRGHELEGLARHTHRHGGPYGLTWFGPHINARSRGRGHQIWGAKAWMLEAAILLIMALLGLWPVSRRLFDAVHTISDARERSLDTVSTAVFVITAAAMALAWLVLNTRRLRHGESAQWRQLGVGLLAALALAGLIFAGVSITGLFE
jgi:hypothetical protein